MKPLWRHLAFWLVVAVLLAWLTSRPALHDTTLVNSIIGIVGDSRTDDDVYLFSLQGNESTYAIRTREPAILKLLELSEESGNSLSMVVHLDGATFELGSGDPRYWVQSLEYLGRKYGPFEARVIRSWRTMPIADAALLRAVAHSHAAHHADAVRELDAADLASLDSTRRKLALETRGSALEFLAYPGRRGVNDKDDALLIHALRDYREAALLDPDDDRLLRWQGNALAMLGAYDQALAAYDEVERRWPEQRFRVIIARAATYRTRGDFAASLREIDKIPRTAEPQGMKFHYHRGWTLIELGQYEEAVKEFTAGLKTQPDYHWAFQKRACAHAQLGHLDMAIADQTAVVASLAKVYAADPEDTLADALAEQRALLVALEQARLTYPGRPTSAACEVKSQNPNYGRRKPSRLLEDL